MPRKPLSPKTLREIKASAAKFAKLPKHVQRCHLAIDTRIGWMMLGQEKERVAKIRDKYARRVAEIDLQEMEEGFRRSVSRFVDQGCFAWPSYIPRSY